MIVLYLRSEVCQSTGFAVSIRSEAVERAGTARAHQIFLAAASGGVRRVPRRVAAACAIMMAELRSARAAARPVLTGVVGGARKGRAIGLRACQHVVGVGFVSEAEDRLALFGKGRRFGPLPAGSIAQ